MVVLLAIAVVALMIVAVPLTNGVFYTGNNLTNLMRQMTTTGLLSLGMLFVILTGGIDLSVGSIVAFSALLAAGLSLRHDLPVPLCFLIGAATGAVWGAISGSLVARFKLAPFVVTLAAMTTIRGLCYVYSDVPIGPKDPGFKALGAFTFKTFKVSGSTLAFPATTLIMIGFFILGMVFLNRTSLGRSTIAIGGNRETVRLAGISVAKGIITAYVISGICAGTAGVLLASRLNNVQPTLGTAYELDAIAACVIGGANLAGGRGTIRGTVMGVLVLAIMNNLLSLRSVDTYWQSVLKGLIIILVILLQARSRQRG
jgi:ribose/xylose/arabinose/galactoside ABC-type transport system permease subunit